mmetsp:Transcript_31042/g.75024  ORF Transcript_31042/g.75024 Transcript_31042/m.75024 type:complete len:92 (-) Transcript_31042:1851-2126(-)
MIHTFSIPGYNNQIPPKNEQGISHPPKAAKPPSNIYYSTQINQANIFPRDNYCCESPSPVAATLRIAVGNMHERATFSNTFSISVAHLVKG